MSRCPAAGCSAKISGDYVACPRHWRQVPKPLRDRIWALYQREQGSDAHREAVFEAIGLLAAKVTP